MAGGIEWDQRYVDRNLQKNENPSVKVSTSPFEWDLINDLSSIVGDENTITKVLLRRLDHLKIYTWIGSLLLALNPGKNIEDLYDESQCKLFVEEGLNHLKKSSPHIYAVANHAQYRLVNGLGKINQVIVISGESGTGKTFNARKAVQFLATKNEMTEILITTNQSTESCRKIIRKIENVIPLISAFSTARTTENSRSSRHGQLLRLQYDKNGFIRGACIDSFLLERTRVTDCSDNFEIFYQLMYGLSDQMIEELLLSRNGNYVILGDCNTKINSRRFADDFFETVASLETLGFTDESRSQIFRIIALLIHMGNIRFINKSNEGCTIDLVNEDSKNSFEKACSLISLPEKDLIELLTTTLICPKSSRGRHTSYRRYLKTTEDCRNRLFAISRFIYDKLFTWLVERVNEILSANDDYNWLGILDIFGFESFNCNGLEQLCINYATERLQLYFMEDYLEAGQRELQEEGLTELSPSSTIQLYRDRLFFIEEIIFSTFNDASQSPIPAELSTLHEKLVLGRKKCSDVFSVRNDVFLIEHYSGLVEYSVNSLLSKNIDKVPNELSFTLAKSENKLLLALLNIEQEDSRSNRVSAKKCTALAKLKCSLDCLVKELNKCDSHYVRCARPRKSSGLWEKNEFKERLKITGIFEALLLARCKFPVKFQYDEFYKRYPIKRSVLNSELLRNLRVILDSRDLTNSIHLGKNVIFLKESIFFHLENYRQNFRCQCAKKIQLFWKRIKQRRRAEYSARLLKKSISERSKNSGKENSESQQLGACTNVSRLGDCDVKNLEITRMSIDDNVDASNVTIEDDFRITEIKSQCTLDNLANPSKRVPRTSSKLEEAERLSPVATIDTWKDVYIRNWLNVNPTKIRHTLKAELTKDTTWIVNLGKYQLFYRNRILSRRRPFEIPVKFHTRITCLRHSHCLPNSLRPHGLEDCLSEKINCVINI